MSDIDVGRILSDMQRLVREAQGGTAAGETPVPQSFAELLSASVEKVNDMQVSAAQTAEAFEKGSAETTLPEVMIALQKANLSFQAMTEVRNRLVSAYQDIMNMPI
jgi:flagellar hook-basal body complex protein FliE